VWVTSAEFGYFLCVLPDDEFPATVLLDAGGVFVLPDPDRILGAFARAECPVSREVLHDAHWPRPGLITLRTYVAGLLIRRSAAPRRRFVRIAIGLTALSCVAPLEFADTTASRIALVGLHLVAAAIIVPVLARYAD